MHCQREVRACCEHTHPPPRVGHLFWQLVWLPRLVSVQPKRHSMIGSDRQHRRVNDQNQHEPRSRRSWVKPPPARSFTQVEQAGNQGELPTAGVQGSLIGRTGRSACLSATWSPTSGLCACRPQLCARNVTTGETAPDLHTGPLRVRSAVVGTSVANHCCPGSHVVLSPTARDQS